MMKEQDYNNLTRVEDVLELCFLHDVAWDHFIDCDVHLLLITDFVSLSDDKSQVTYLTNSVNESWTGYEWNLTIRLWEWPVCIYPLLQNIHTT